METKFSQQHFKEALSPAVPENYERFFVPAIAKPLAESLIERATLRPGERVLDVACGTGIVARLAAAKVGATGRTTGLDLHPGMLSIARSLTASTKEVEWIEGSAEDMPLPDGEFDVVFCQLALQFIEDKAAALREMYRVLAPEGRACLNAPGPAGTVFSIFADVMERLVNAQAAGFLRRVFSLHDIDVLRELMTRAGFGHVSVKENNKTLNLPAPEEFLWQYINGSPLTLFFSELDGAARAAFEHEVVDKWQPFTRKGKLIYEQRVVEVIATR